MAEAAIFAKVKEDKFLEIMNNTISKVQRNRLGEVLLFLKYCKFSHYQLKL